MNQTVHFGRKTAPAVDAAARGKARPAARKRPATTRTNDPARTMAEILAMATREFAAKGLDGARIDEIAAATRTSKRMIYYYFESKEGLYRAVLENSYGYTRAIESQLRLEDLDPVAALKKLVVFTYDHHRENEDFIRLVMSENMQYGAYLRESPVIQKLNVPAIDAIRDIYQRGVALRLFRKGLDPVTIHSIISAFTFFNVSNRYTFGLIFGDKSTDGKAATLSREHVVELTLRFVWNTEPA